VARPKVPPKKKRAPRQPTHTWVYTGGERDCAAADGFESIALFADGALSFFQPKSVESPTRLPKGRAAKTEQHDPFVAMVTLLAGAKTSTAEFRALVAAAQRDVALPADAHVIGESVEVVAIEPGAHARAGLLVACRREGVTYQLSLADVVFAPGSAGARFVSTYRMWLGLGEVPALATKAVAPAKRAKASEGDVPLGEPLDLIVLARKSNALRCRVPGTARELTLRSAVGDEIPGETITVSPTKQWTHARHPYLSGVVQASRADVAALGLTPLGLQPCGDWDPTEDYWREEGEPVDDVESAILARGKRPMFEFEQVMPGEDPDDYDSDPILEASELKAMGERKKAHDLLMGLLAQDLRCLDAHAHLGNFDFDRRPDVAIRHYEMGVAIGLLTLGTKFDGVLAWGLIDNRPFMRCLFGLGLCAWRLGKRALATTVFRKLLWLNPADNQGARFNLTDIEDGREWQAEG
jgi:hypothetical protein